MKIVYLTKGKTKRKVVVVKTYKEGIAYLINHHPTYWTSGNWIIESEY